MTSGAKQDFINPNERALSTDINRLQAFANAEVGELFRYLANVSCGNDDVQAAGTATQTTTSTSPMSAEVVNGLCVLPQVGSLNLLVEPGVVMCIDPDATESPDDSVYKYVNDPGVSVTGTLVMPAGSAAGPIIAIVEVSRQTTTLESDSRDIFNVSTGVYNATTVPKVVGSSLVYRVRAGAANSGFPGTATGWLPLMVALVSTNATSNDTMTFWDVRPMLADRAFGPGMKIGLAFPKRTRGLFNGAVLSAVSGIFELIDLAGKRAGGQLHRGSPGVDGTTMDLTAVANQDPAMAGTANSMATVALCFPFSLPRWATYTTAASGSRVPRSPRGIPVLTPSTFTNYGLVEGTVTLPVALGFGAATTSVAIAVMSVPWVSNAPQPVVGDDNGGYYSVLCPSVTYTGTAQTATATLAAGVNLPPNARSVRVRAVANITAIGSGVDTASLTVSLPNSATVAFTEEIPITLVAAGLTVGLVFEAWMPLPDAYPGTADVNHTFTLSFSNEDDFVACVFSVIGWRY